LLTGTIGAPFDSAALARLETRLTLLLPSAAPIIERDSAARLSKQLAGSAVEIILVGDDNQPPGRDWTSDIARALLTQAGT
jgi:molybdopterin-guanine dinucleotide biosynthesis protein A